MAAARPTLVLPNAAALRRPPVPQAKPIAGLFEPAKAPWIKPGVIVHEPGTRVDELLAKFALSIRGRGFSVAGYVQRCDEQNGTMQLLDLATDQAIAIPAGGADGEASRRMRSAMRDDADLVVISHFTAMEQAAKGLMASVDGAGSGASAGGMPVLTSVTGGEIQSWLDFAGQDGTMMPPNMKALWRWWGPERLYRDLALGVADDEVRQIACGPRWIMVEGPHGSGLAYLPRFPKELLGRLPSLARQSLRQLARLSASWDPLEMALGIAAINAHYNRADLDSHMGNGAHLFSKENGRVVAIGAFPGLGAVLPNCAVIETDPRPGEYPTVAMDTLLPGCAAAVVNSSSMVNRTLPRVLRLAQGARVALVGPVTPMTPRLYHYGIEVLGGLVVHDPVGLGNAIRTGALPREFGQFGQFLHIRHDQGPEVKPCRFKAQKNNILT